MLPASLNLIRFFVHEIPPRKSLESFSFNIQFFDSELTSSVWWSFTNDPTKQNFLQISPGRRRVGSRPNNVKTGKTLSSWNFLVFFCTCTCHSLQFQYSVSPLHDGNITSILTRVHVSSETRKGILPSCSCTCPCAEEIEWDLQVSWVCDNGLEHANRRVWDSLSHYPTPCFCDSRTPNTIALHSQLLHFVCMSRCVDFAWFENPYVDGSVRRSSTISTFTAKRRYTLLRRVGGNLCQSTSNPVISLFTVFLLLRMLSNASEIITSYMLNDDNSVKKVLVKKLEENVLSLQNSRPRGLETLYKKGEKVSSSSRNNSRKKSIKSRELKVLLHCWNFTNSFSSSSDFNHGFN